MCVQNTGVAPGERPPCTQAPVLLAKTYAEARAGWKHLTEHFTLESARLMSLKHPGEHVRVHTK